MPKIKTAISVSKALFDEIDRYARKNGMSRSEVFESGARELVRRHRNQRMTEKFNAVYGGANPEAAVDQAWHDAAARGAAKFLKDDKW